jgi:hypothetical protein
MPMDAATLDATRTQLHQAVAAHIAILEQADDATFTAAWDDALRPPEAVWQAYHRLPLLAFPDDPPPDQRHAAALLLAPALVAPTLAALAFAPGGLPFGPTTWAGQHPAATRLIGYHVTADGDGPLALPVAGGWTPLHRRVVQTLHLMFPFAALRLRRLPAGERWAAVQRTAASLSPESPLFSEALTVGGTAAQVAQATTELIAAVAALACLPYGVPMFGFRWEIVTKED